MKVLSAGKCSLACFVIALALVASGAGSVAMADAVASVDDFNHPENNSLGFPRVFITDQSVGGQSALRHTFENGVFEASGEIAPPRGQPGWASTTLLLDAQGQAMDASAYTGIRLRVRIQSGNLSVTANSTAISNYDYHAAPLQQQADDDFHEVRVPFDSMKRAWSEQVPLDPATLASISLVAFDIKPGAFAYEVDEVGFY